MQRSQIIYLILRRLRTPLIVLVCVYAVSVLGFVLIPGVDDQGNPWKMDFFHAFYFVSYMGSTIGFGELPYPFYRRPADLGPPAPYTQPLLPGSMPSVLCWPWCRVRHSRQP